MRNHSNQSHSVSFSISLLPREYVCVYIYELRPSYKHILTSRPSVLTRLHSKLESEFARSQFARRSNAHRDKGRNDKRSNNLDGDIFLMLLYSMRDRTHNLLSCFFHTHSQWLEERNERHCQTLKVNIHGGIHVLIYIFSFSSFSFFVCHERWKKKSTTTE